MVFFPVFIPVSRSSMLYRDDSMGPNMCQTTDVCESGVKARATPLPRLGRP
jgi:hypothetical protein